MLLLALAWGCTGSVESETTGAPSHSEQAPSKRSLLWVVGPLLDSALKQELDGCGRACVTQQITRTVSAGAQPLVR